MEVYFNELSPWERKKQYFEDVKLGHSIERQSDILKKGIRNQIEAQLISANSIVASQERISELIESGFENISSHLNSISEGIYNLKAVFEWGISEVLWQFELSNKTLKDILEVLASPLDTQALELKKRAVEAYVNGWYDDALEDFLLSEEKNRYDFSIHISIGMIYLFQKIDKNKALDYFNKAIKYSKPKSNYYTSYSLMYKGLILFDLNRIEEAEKVTEEAIQLSPQFTEIYYQNAMYNASLNNIEKSIKYLEKSFREDDNYILKADNDEFFNVIRQQVNDLICKLRDEKIDYCLTLIRKFDDKLKLLNSIIYSFNSQTGKNIELIYTKKDMEGIEHLLSLKSYFDTKRAISDILSLNNKLNARYLNLKNTISNTLNEYNSTNLKETKKIEKLNEDKFKKKSNYALFIAIVLGSILLISGFISGCEKYNNNIRADITKAFGSLFLNVLGYGIGAVIVFIVILWGLESLFEKSNKNAKLNNVKTEFEKNELALKKLITQLDKYNS